MRHEQESRRETALFWHNCIIDEGAQTSYSSSLAEIAQPPDRRSNRTGPHSTRRLCGITRLCCASTRRTRRETRSLPADYLKQVLEKEGIPASVLFVEPNRPNVVARLKGN